jgi:hypothetical protein
MAEVIGAFCWCDCTGDAAECAPERIDGSVDFLTQLGLHFCEDHFDRIEVGAIGRQEQQLSAGRFDSTTDGGDFMDGKVVHDDDVELAVTSDHALAVDMLSHIHKDPFDRLLIAQALAEDLSFVTADAQLSAYPGDVRLV